MYRVGFFVLGLAAIFFGLIALGMLLLRSDFDPLEMSPERKFWYIFALGKREK
jgi:hypothetical protein